jgi:hypothetical protein
MFAEPRGPADLLSWLGSVCFAVVACARSTRVGFVIRKAGKPLVRVTRLEEDGEPARLGASLRHLLVDPQPTPLLLYGF